MPEHTSFFTYLFARIPGLREAAASLGKSAFGKPVSLHTIEPLLVGTFVALCIIAIALLTRAKITDYDKAVIPEEKLTLRTFMELAIGFIYDTMKDAMGPTRAKKYFPVVATAALFVFFGNAIELIPGFVPPTSSWDVTFGCAIVIFVAFNYYGLKENGFAYIKHLAGPVWWLAWLIFPLELMSMFIRPLTLSVRLMLNMSVDHLLVDIFHGLVMFVVPVMIMLLSTLVIFVQAYVFTLLSTVYIALATEHEHEDHGHGEGHVKKPIRQTPVQPPA